MAMENLLSLREYTEKIKAELKVLLKGNDEGNDKLAEAFAEADNLQTGTIDKSGLATVLEKANVKISKKRGRELSISMSTRHHGEVCLDELVALAESIKANHGHIDTKLLKSADHCLPSGHINPGNMSQSAVKVASENGKGVKANNSSGTDARGGKNLRRIPSCELLDQIGTEMESKNTTLLYQIDEYAKELYTRLDQLAIDEENRVTIAEAFADVDFEKSGSVSDSELDNLFKACRRELPGYAIRQIIADRKTTAPISLVEFAQLFMKQRESDVANTFKTSIKEAKGIVNKRNNEVEVEHMEHESYLASHAYSLAERRAFSTWLNNHLVADKDCAQSIPIDVETEVLFSSLSDGIVLCKAINCARPGTVDERVLNKHPKGKGSEIC